MLSGVNKVLLSNPAAEESRICPAFLGAALSNLCKVLQKGDSRALMLHPASLPVPAAKLCVSQITGLQNGCSTFQTGR